jgi:hypothetical protein
MSQMTAQGFRGSILVRIGVMTAILAVTAVPAWAGLAGFNNNRAVGGIVVDADGVVRQATPVDHDNYLRFLREETQKVDPKLNDPVALRKVSLRGLEAAIAQAVGAGEELPDSVRYLAGLQRIQYVFVYPEQNDIVIAGPGEGWKVGDGGSIVGVTTGRPVLLLDDLIVALRTVQAARTEGISVSIDPTKEGRRRFDALISQQRNFTPQVVGQIAKAMGPQEVTYTGIPTNSHFSRILVAADHQMKRLAMKLDASPVRGLVSYLDLLKAKNQLPGSATPRWWMACNYEPLARSNDRLSWELRGTGVKAMTEDEFIAADGNVQGTGRADPVAKQWADQLTAHFEELSKQDSVFGELRNLMDLCVVAALIQREDLAGLAGVEGFPMLTGKDTGYKIEEWFAPQAISTQCSYLKIGRNYVITASGGVQIESWEVASKQQVRPEVSEVRAKATPASDESWWWN